MTARLVDLAVRFLMDNGLPMLPSTGSRKGPCVDWKHFQEQLPSEVDLRGWAQQFRPARWGFVTGKLAGVMVVDFDNGKGVELMHKWGIKPHVRTGSGAFHLHVWHPGWRVPTLNAKTSKKSWPWPGVDIRGDGGFAVLLGRNADGPYRILRDLVPEPWDSLPDELRTLLRNHSRDNQTARASSQTRNVPSGRRVPSERLIRDALEVAASNGRNNAGFWLACQLRDNGYDSGQAESAMRHFRSRVKSTNTKGAREPYTEAEMLASLHQAYSRPAREPWTTPNPHGGVSRATASSRRVHPAGGDSGAATKARHLPLSANGPKSIGLYVGHTGEPLVGHTGEPLYSKDQYSRVPREVCEDRRLRHRDRSVYAALASACYQGSVAELGKRRIAKLARCAERLVVESLSRLVATGHIQKAPGWRRGQRRQYVLVSGVFGQKQRADVQETAFGPKGRLRLVTVRKEQGVAWTSNTRPVAVNRRREKRVQG